MSQELAIEKIKSGENVVVLGQAGTGKTYTIDQIVDQNTVKCAPTGIAALNVGGMTCHSMFNLPVGKPSDEDYFVVGKTMERLFGSGSPITRVCCDEIGMLRADYLDMIDSKLRTLRRNTKPFGGIQFVGSGDFYQLEPIIGRDEVRYFNKRYNSPYCFDADSWDFSVIELTKVFRQEDERQVALLKSIREKDKWCDRAIEVIQAEAKEYDPSPNTLHLCCYKTDANKVNKMWYRRLDGKEKTYLADNKAKWKEVELSVPEKLTLRVGCRVLVKANDKEGEYVNGDRGEVLGFEPDGVWIRLDRNQKEVRVVSNTWEKFKYGVSSGKINKQVESTYTQIPLMLGYAVTVHSCQGMTLDDVAIDFGQGCFSAGQAYVALSRIKDLRNISFVNEIYPTDIIVREEVNDFYDSLRGY